VARDLCGGAFAQVLNRRGGLRVVGANSRPTRVEAHTSTPADTAVKIENKFAPYHTAPCETGLGTQNTFRMAIPAEEEAQDENEGQRCIFRI